MIISASKRTDIPALYSQWFLNRLKGGYVLVQNPRNPHRYSRVEFSPDTVDMIVFWTKNPKPLLPRLKEIDTLGYPYYFQFTITPYGDAIESGLPKKSDIMRTFCTLSDRIGPDRTIWRYDPIIISSVHTIDFHLKAFEEMARLLHPYTQRCVISFIDLYTSVHRRTRETIDYHLTMENIHRVAHGLSQIADHYNLKLYTCAEDIDLSSYGIEHGSCVDKKLIESLLGCSIEASDDPNQRNACRCIDNFDIGTYDSCTNGCIYCYAVSDTEKAQYRYRLHDPDSPLLIGKIDPKAVIKQKIITSFKVKQLPLF